MKWSEISLYDVIQSCFSFPLCLVNPLFASRFHLPRFSVTFIILARIVYVLRFSNWFFFHNFYASWSRFSTITLWSLSCWLSRNLQKRIDILCLIQKKKWKLKFLECQRNNRNRIVKKEAWKYCFRWAFSMSNEFMSPVAFFIASPAKCL